MNCLVEIVDTCTGEILLTSTLSYVFNNEKHDPGYAALTRFLNHVIEKTRFSGNPFQLRLFFHDKTKDSSLPFQTTLNFDNPYEVKKF